MSEFRDRFRGDSGFYAKRLPNGGWDDGWPHKRDKNGWCKNCDAPPRCSHIRLVRQ